MCARARATSVIVRVAFRRHGSRRRCCRQRRRRRHHDNSLSRYPRLRTHTHARTHARARALARLTRSSVKWQILIAIVCVYSRARTRVRERASGRRPFRTFFQLTDAATINFWLISINKKISRFLTSSRVSRADENLRLLAVV